MTLITGSMFSGIGLLDYGLHLAGLQHAWFAERDEYRRGILAQRWPGRAVLGDVRKVGAGTVERVDLVAGGFPCKGVSSAGRGAGFDHPETVLWREMRRAIGELEPGYVLVENVARLRTLKRGEVFAEVLGDLAALGFDAWWDCLPAAAFGAPHRRDRIFIVAAHPDRQPMGERWMRRQAGSADQGAAVDSACFDPAYPRSDRGSRRQSGPVAAVGAREAVADPNDEQRSEEQAGDVRLAQQRPTLGRRTEQPAEPGRHDAAALRRDPAASAVGRGLAAIDDRASADADGGRLAQLAQRNGGTQAGQQGAQRDDAQRRGIRVEWGRYRAAVERWEQIHGPAPEPLVRRVDDGRAARLERSRLSALGDGVQVQAGWLAGTWILNHAAQHAAELREAIAA